MIFIYSIHSLVCSTPMMDEIFLGTTLDILINGCPNNSQLVLSCPDYA
jgi:hypothetical protein